MNRKIRNIGLAVYSAACVTVFVLFIIFNKIYFMGASSGNSPVKFLILFITVFLLMLFSVIVFFKISNKISREEEIKKLYAETEKEFQAEYGLFLFNKDKYAELRKIKHDINNILQSAKAVLNNGGAMSNKETESIINELEDRLDALNKMTSEDCADV